MTAIPRIAMTRDADRQGNVLLGEDWVNPDAESDAGLREARTRRGLFALKGSPLARKIIVFNLMALLVMVAGVLFLNPFRDTFVQQRERGLVVESRLVANVFEARLAALTPAADLAQASQAIATSLALEKGVEIYVFDPQGAIVAQATGAQSIAAVNDAELARPTVITDFLSAIWDGVSRLVVGRPGESEAVSPERMAVDLFSRALVGETVVHTGRTAEGGPMFSVASPIQVNGAVQGVVALAFAEGEIERLVRYEREQILQMFVIALLVSIGLSVLLASTIANPLADLAAAAEMGRDRDARKLAPGRVRIPDLTARPDEIGRLSVAMRGMVAALYDRIEANEQFAADVAHEIKNPLASLRSAVGTMRVAKRDDQRERLLEVIEHDVRRLDRLVSDISNASRLDSELVKEEEEAFDLLKTVSNLSEYLGKQAGEKGVEFVTDLPDERIIVRGLEGRLAQVFVNLITNAISFCEDGDAVRVWVRQRDNRVLVVVEDTGPGIPEQALTKVFKRFYSERPQNDFGNHSGLGLAISKQIVEAHGGVIWAENIRPTHADMTSEPLGARFVVGLPV
ncbi:MAG: sensor histidine kinase [Rhodobacteraceae bacterium]|jgi:two-component system, OmpR family, sensor histidine kinase ChvG|nr:sensor histidine kinase [Paracoccaceae bacterium]